MEVGVGEAPRIFELFWTTYQVASLSQVGVEGQRRIMKVIT